jgi:exopolysaccharide production protein ExoY
MCNNTVDQHLRNTKSGGRFNRFRSIVRPTAKYLFDSTAAAVLFMVILPLFLLILLSLICSVQSPFYSHVRIGRGRREFGCLKFRTMRSDAGIALAMLLEHNLAAKIEWETNRKLRRDPRVTRIGKLLRATSLDEVPQLFNIMMGQMSLVGPRPITKDEFSKFYAAADVAASYCSVRPGLTGLWQVSGRSGTCYATRVALDVQYVQRLSLRTDLAILLRTLNVVIWQKGAW